MFDQGLFEKHFVGRDGFIWWIGQIASEASWKENIPGTPQDDNSDIKGFGERYRVRIMGYHTADLSKIPDEQLPWAYVMYPVTAGGGGRSSSQSANLTQGNFVFGFFLDGENAQLPVVFGCIGYNDYQAVNKNLPPTRFLPFSGYTENDYVAWYSQKAQSGGEVAQQDGAQKEGVGTQVEASGALKGESNNQTLTESANGDTTQKSAASESQKKDKQTQPLAQSSECERIPLGRIQKQIANVIVDIQEAQKSIYKYRDAVQNQVGDIQEFINKKIAEASQFIAQSIKWVFVESQKFLVKQTSEAMKNTYYLLFPNERPALKKAVDSVLDLIACLFRKLIAGLLGMVESFLGDAINKVINAAECFVENFIAATLGQIMAKLSNAVNQALSSITSLVGQAASIAGDVLGLITDLLSFLSCDDRPECSKVNEWSILSGGDSVSFGDIESLIGKAKNFAAGFENSTDLDNFDFDLNFDNIFGADSCDIGPLLCGPPIPKITGGFGAAGNFVIGAAGEVLGIDMLSFGVGYDEGAFASVYDGCGKGSGAVIRPVVSDVEVVNADNPQRTTNLPATIDPRNEFPPGTITKGVTGIIVEEPGTGYLPGPDGSQGGNESTWADPDDTVVKEPDGTYLVPAPPGEIVIINPGDIVTLPPTTVVITEPQPGGGDTPGGGGGTGGDGDTPGGGGGGTGGGGGPGDVGGGDGTLNPLDPQPFDPGTGGDTPGTGGGTGGGGGTVTTPGQGGGEEIPGGVDYVVQLPGVFTAPRPDFEKMTQIYPSDSSGSYPVILYLCEIRVVESGIKYRAGDELVIEPSIGAQGSFTVDKQGRVTSVKITESGEGFTEFPRIYIKSETGYNAVLRPRLCIDRIGEDKFKSPELQDKVITVIDCVGNF